MKRVGYTKLIQQYDLAVIANWHESAIAPGTVSGTEISDGRVRDIYRASYDPGDRLGAQLEFALKYDGINLLILSKLFAIVEQADIVAYVQSKPTGKNARRVCYIYELLTGNRLPIDDLNQGNYIDLLDAKLYYTAPGRSIRRQRIGDNLLGSSKFCPTIRRTPKLIRFEQSNLAERCRRIMRDYPLDLLRRALGNLYTKESKSSFELEHIKPAATRTERFVALLQTAEKDDFFNKQSLIDLQNQIVDERFKDSDYRASQNYVGQSVSWQHECVHYFSPKPTDLASLMDGMFSSHARMGAQAVHAVIHAAVVAYGFVFMHPFEDGNGRIHRFLIHNILSSRGFTPAGIMFPVSAAMLKRTDLYDASLEAFSKALMPLVDYALDEQGWMNVNNDTLPFYCYIDMTAQAEALFDFIRETIEVELAQELQFLVNYDNTKRPIHEIMDMPDRLIDLLIGGCLQNHGRLSKRKRNEFFAMLSDEEVAKMEAAVQVAYRR